MVSIQPFLAELQAYVISIEVMPMKSQPGNKQPDRVHFLAALSLNRTKDCLLLVHCRAESLGPLYGHRHQLSRYHTSLHTFALIGKRALHILSSRIQLKEDLRMSPLFAIYLMFTSINLTSTFTEHLLNARYGVGSTKTRRGKALLWRCLPPGGGDANAQIFSRKLGRC